MTNGWFGVSLAELSTLYVPGATDWTERHKNIYGIMAIRLEQNGRYFADDILNYIYRLKIRAFQFKFHWRLIMGSSW